MDLGSERRSKFARFLTTGQIDASASPAFTLFGIASILAVGGAAFLTSFRGLTEVGYWTTHDYAFAWMTPVVVDGAIVAFTLAAVIRRARGLPTWSSWSLVLLFTGYSVFANVVHLLSTGQPDLQLQVGWINSAVPPLTILFVTHELLPLFVRTPTKNRSDRAAEFEQRREADVAELEFARRLARWPEIRDQSGHRDEEVDTIVFIHRQLEAKNPRKANRMTQDTLGISKAKLDQAFLSLERRGVNQVDTGR